MNNPLPTVDELNKIQADWMALDPTGDLRERERVIRSMEQYPAVYLSITPDGALANVVVDHMPLWANRRPTAEAVEYVKAMRTWKQKRTDVAWCGQDGKWVAL